MTLDANWWEFGIRADDRGDRITSGVRGLREVNPVDQEGRAKGSYYAYLQLESLLSCQIPSSRVPDERVFIIVHQMFELVFKQMIFDLAVISSTIDLLVSNAEAGRDTEFITLCSTKDELGFWSPAVTAANRLEHSTTKVLPELFGYLRGHSVEEDAVFSSREFYRFRSYLAPASGFQSAQFRLIQTALGKARPLKITIFPGADYRWNYHGVRQETLLSVTNPDVLAGRHLVAVPMADSPLAEVAALNSRAHKLLSLVVTVSRCLCF
jgi:hypothetical protein